MLIMRVIIDRISQVRELLTASEFILTRCFIAY